MTCDELRDHLPLHALGLLEEPERSEVEEHLRVGCPQCTQNLRRTIETNAMLFAAVPDVAPSPGLRRRVLATVGIEEKKRGFFGSPAWAALAAGLTIAVVWLGVRDRRAAGELAEARNAVIAGNVEATRVRQALDLLNQPETRQVVFGESQKQPPKGRVFVHAQQGVLLIAGNLPPAGAGKTYELWVIPKGGAPKPAGIFQSTGGQAVFLSPGPVDVSALAAVAVSVEPESGSPAPTTTPIIVAPVGG